MDVPVRFLTTSDGVRIAYCTHGDGPPLVFVRGWMGHLELLWRDVAFRSYFEALAASFHVVRYDARGHGLSQWQVQEVSLEALVRDLEAVIDELALTNVALYGATFGGPIAIAYTAMHPERIGRLILDGTYARGREIASPERQDAIVMMIRNHPDLAFQHVLSRLTHPDPEEAPYRRARAREIASPEMAARLYELGYEIDVSAVCPEIHVPALVLHREGSRAIPFRLGQELAALLPDARFVPLEGSAHNSWEGDAPAALAAVGEFLGAPVAEFARTRGGVQTPHPASSLPEGTAIILFLDIAESTPLTEQLGDAAFRKKASGLDTSLRRAIHGAGGTPVEGKVLGDGIMSVFTSARQAIDCALRCREVGEEAGLPLHLGIHAGDVIREGNTVYGGAVNIAQRVTDGSAPGEILVTDTVRSLARTSTDVTFEDRGERALKGIAEPHRLFAVTDPN